MNQFNRIDIETRPFDVHIGLARVRVEAHTAEEAIRAAREAFCREMPRMWDVIWNLTAQQFVVEPAAEAA